MPMPPSVDYCQVQHVGVAAQWACPRAPLLSSPGTVVGMEPTDNHHQLLSKLVPEVPRSQLEANITVATNGMRTRQVTTTTRRRVPVPKRQRKRNLPKHIGRSGIHAINRNLSFFFWWHGTKSDKLCALRSSRPPPPPPPSTKMDRSRPRLLL
jgi:hypothetical protein